MFTEIDAPPMSLLGPARETDEGCREAATLTGRRPIALLFGRLSASRLVSVAETEGRVRAAGSHGFQTRDAELDLNRVIG